MVIRDGAASRLVFNLFQSIPDDVITDNDIINHLLTVVEFLTLLIHNQTIITLFITS